MGKTALLTIDDGPSTLTVDLVRFLQERRIPAVMFFQGNHLELHPDEARRALDAGMVLGNHGFSHSAFSQLTPAQGEAEMVRTEELLEAVYQKAGLRRPLRLFRFPYGDKGGPKKSEFAEVLGRLGFDHLDTSAITYPWFADHGLHRDRDVFWTFDTGDYKVANPDYTTSWAHLIAHLDEPRPTQGGSLVEGDSAEILLIHDHPHTEALHSGYFRDLVLGIRDRGVEFVPPVRWSP